MVIYIVSQLDIIFATNTRLTPLVLDIDTMAYDQCQIPRSMLEIASVTFVDVDDSWESCTKAW
jgi:hypothetical protein